MQEMTRRKFVALTATGLAAAPLALGARATGGALMAQDVIDRIKKSLGGEWKADSVDGFKAGDPSTPVTGIATTALASLEVLGRAVKARANLIVTCEPTFFAHADSPTPPVRRSPGSPNAASNAAVSSGPPPEDPVFTGKDGFIKKHNLVVWRLSDHWKSRTPNPYAQGLVDTLGWSKPAGAEAGVVEIPETSLEALAMHVKSGLKSRGGMRIIGRPELRVRRIALLPGSTPIQASVEKLPGVDAILAGEVREWETAEYVRDTVDLGGKKGLILVGRTVSEDPGMQVCARWLKTVVPEVATTWMPVGDPYWRPV